MLSPSDFDKLSYFRNTVMMFVAVSTSSLGLYFLNYHNEFFGCKKYHYSFIALPLMTFTALFIVLFTIFYLFQDFFRLDTFISSEGLVIILSIFAVVALSQLSIVMVKAIGEINKKLIFNFFIIMAIVICVGVFLMQLYGFRGSLYYFLLAYFVIFLLMGNSLKVYKPESDRKLDFYYIKNKLKIFIIPNFFESLFSIIAPWLMLFFLIRHHGFEGVGSLLFYQALLSLSVFFSYSLILNQFGSIEKNFDSVRVFTKNAEKKFFEILLLIIPLLALFSNELKNIFNLNGIDDFNLVFMLIGTVLQVQVIVTTIGFKRLDMSSRTLYHNLIYSLILTVLSFVFTFYFKIYGYGISFFLSWIIVYLIIMRDIHNVLFIASRGFVINAFVLIFSFLFIFISMIFFAPSLMVKLLLLLLITSTFWFFIIKREKNGFLSKIC
jgi:O-antigen/teichoic acid export membrane protein